MQINAKTLAATIIICAGSAAQSDPVRIEAARADRFAESWKFSVTLRHPDSGWDHYADGWEVLSPDGSSLGVRKLLHPHVTEQPFTRSLGNVTIAADTDHVIIRAHCNVDGWADDSFELVLVR